MSDQKPIQRIFAYVYGRSCEELLGAKYHAQEGIILCVEGAEVQIDFDNSPYLSDWTDIHPVTDSTGLLVWEGIDTGYRMGDPDEGYEPSYSGEWRRPTPHELRRLASDIPKKS